jgi:hypothetical protein
MFGVKDELGELVDLLVEDIGRVEELLLVLIVLVSSVSHQILNFKDDFPFVIVRKSSDNF